MKLVPGYLTKALVEDSGSLSRKDNKIRVRVPEFHGFSSTDGLDRNSLPWAVVQTPFITSNIRYYINTHFAKGDFVYVLFPSGRPNDIIVTGNLTRTTASGTGGDGGYAYNGDISNAKSFEEYFGYPFALSVMSYTSPFGPRDFQGLSYHHGVDLSTWEPYPEIYPIHSGTVADTGYGPAIGNYVLIDHGYCTVNGTKHKYFSKYCHLASSSPVYKGQTVIGVERCFDRTTPSAPATSLGRMGNTGSYSFGTHLHLEIHLDTIDNWVNPADYLILPSPNFS